MLTQELIEYIRQAQNAGMTETQIRKALAESGWASRDIEQALAAMNKPFDTERAERVAASITPVVSTEPAREPIPQPSVVYQPSTTAQTNTAPPQQPQQPSQEVPVAQESISPEPRMIPEMAPKKRRTGLLVAIGAILILLLGGTAYAYVAYTSLPRVVVAQAIEEAATVKTYETVGSFSVTIRESGASSSPQPMSMTVTADAVAQYDMRASSTPRVHADITLGGDVGGVGMQGTGEVAIIGKEFFFRVREIPAMLAAGLGSNYAFIRDRWFSINPDTLPDDLRRAGMPEEAITEFTSSKNDTCSSRSPHTSFAEIARTNIDALTEQETESIEGEAARVYALQGTKEFWVGILTSLINEACADDRAALDELLAAIDESVHDLSITATVAIGKRSHHVRRVTFELSGTATQPESVPLEAGVPTSATFTVHTSTVFRKFNEPIEIVRPDPSTSLVELILASLREAQTF